MPPKPALPLQAGAPPVPPPPIPDEPPVAPPPVPDEPPVAPLEPPIPPEDPPCPPPPVAPPLAEAPPLPTLAGLVESELQATDSVARRVQVTVGMYRTLSHST